MIGSELNTASKVSRNVTAVFLRELWRPFFDRDLETNVMELDSSVSTSRLNPTKMRLEKKNI